MESNQWEHMELLMQELRNGKHQVCNVVLGPYKTSSDVFCFDGYEDVEFCIVRSEGELKLIQKVMWHVTSTVSDENPIHVCKVFIGDSVETELKMQSLDDSDDTNRELCYRISTSDHMTDQVRLQLTVKRRPIIKVNADWTRTS
jgi:hypothetical protein